MDKLGTIRKEDFENVKYEVDEHGNETGVYYDQYGNKIKPWHSLIYETLGGFPPPGEWIAIDCGANVGELTKSFYEKGALVYAFEPNKAAFEYLDARVNTPSIKCYNKAVSDKSGTMKLYMHRKLKGVEYRHWKEDEQAFRDHINFSQGCSLKFDKRNVDEDHYQEVECIRLCSFIQKIMNDPTLPDIFLLKIDVEGAEVDLLRDLLDTGLAKKIPVILVETHDQKVPSIADEMANIRKRIDAGRMHGLYHNIHLNWI